MEQKKEDNYFKRKVNQYLDRYFEAKIQELKNQYSDFEKELNSKLLDLEEDFKQKNNGFELKFKYFEDEISQLKMRNELFCSDIGDRLGRVEENVRNTNDRLSVLEENEKTTNDRLCIVEENVRDTNGRLSVLEENEKTTNDRLCIVEKNVRNTNVEMMRLDRKISGDYQGLDYVDFESRFRGSKDEIRSRQQYYLQYFMGKKSVVDVGCGEGVFLELLRDNGIESRGTDLYAPYVDSCRKSGLNVENCDAIDYVRKQESMDGLFAAQLVEHLSYHQIKELSDLAYQRMEDNGVMILETPNPMTLSVFTHAFYMDPTHIRPIHPYTLQYIVSKSGFRKVEILYTPMSKYPENIPALKSNSIDNLEEFNRSMSVVSETMFGSQDYAIIAIK